MRRNGSVIGETRAKFFNDADRGHIDGIAGNRDRLINRPNERREGTTSLKRITMTAVRLSNPEADMPCTNSNMRGVSNSKIDVTNIRTIRG